MDWSRAKNIFIITFLLLNLFLGYQLMEKRKDSNYNYISRATLQENLEQMNIEVHLDEMDEVIFASPISGSFYYFNEKLLEERLKNQNFELLTETTLHSKLETPYKLVTVNLPVVVESFVQQNVFRGDEYTFSSYNEEQNYIGLHQTYKGKPVDNNEGSGYHLILYLNDEFEITGYYQTYMELEQQGREQELLTPIKAIERLYNEQLIPADTVIDHVKLGYYSHLPPSGNYQVYTPMWQISVNDEFYYVNAIDGAIQSMDQVESGK